jgi:hypothetical protein
MRRLVTSLGTGRLAFTPAAMLLAGATALSAATAATMALLARPLVASCFGSRCGRGGLIASKQTFHPANKAGYLRLGLRRAWRLVGLIRARFEFASFAPITFAPFAARFAAPIPRLVGARFPRATRFVGTRLAPF